MFGSTYLCEQLFSFMKSTKTSQRTSLTDHHLSSLIKLKTAQKFQPDIPKIANNKRCQASAQNIKCLTITVHLNVHCICCCCIHIHVGHVCCLLNFCYIEIKNRFIFHANFYCYIPLLSYMYACTCILKYDQIIACLYIKIKI